MDVGYNSGMVSGGIFLISIFLSLLFFARKLHVCFIEFAFPFRSFQEKNLVWRGRFLAAFEEILPSVLRLFCDMIHGESMKEYFLEEARRSSGLYYFNARWYDPKLGRFITEDPIRDGLNWYGYCGNNPVNRVDPTGLRYATEDTITENTILYEPSPKTPDEILDEKSLQYQNTLTSNQYMIFDILGDAYQGQQIDLANMNVLSRGPGCNEILNSASAVNILNPFLNTNILGLQISEINMLINAMAGRGTSLPNNTVYMPNGVSGYEDLLIHEAFHQFQYQTEGLQNVFSRAIMEQYTWEISGRAPSQNPYNVANNIRQGLTMSTISSLNDINTVESQAQYIQDFAENYYYYNSRPGGAYPSSLKQTARVLENSGMYSNAIREVLR